MVALVWEVGGGGEGFPAAVDLLPLPILKGAGVLEVAILRAVQDKKEKLFLSLFVSQAELKHFSNFPGLC